MAVLSSATRYLKNSAECGEQGSQNKPGNLVLKYSVSIKLIRFLTFRRLIVELGC